MSRPDVFPEIAQAAADLHRADAELVVEFDLLLKSVAAIAAIEALPKDMQNIKALKAIRRLSVQCQETLMWAAANRADLREEYDEAVSAVEP
jgi:hypothetical protein